MTKPVFNKMDKVNQFFDKYPEQMQVFESKSILARPGFGGVTADHLIALGQQLDAQRNYENFVAANESSGLSRLGMIPAVSLDVITATAITSILPLYASEQTLDEELGLVWYRNILNANKFAHGGYEAGQSIITPGKLASVGDGTFGNQYIREVIGSGDAATTDFTGNLSITPLRPHTIEVNIKGLGPGRDNGFGQIMGYGYFGEVDYETGKVDIHTSEALEADVEVMVQVKIDADRITDIPKIDSSYATKQVEAQIRLIGAEVGQFSQYQISRRFGEEMSDSAAQDLTDALTLIQNSALMHEIVRASEGKDVEVFNTNAPTGVSDYDHKLSFSSTFALAESNLHLKSGISNIRRIAAGRKAAAFLRGLPEWVPASTEVTTDSPIEVYGYYDNIPVVRATGIVEDNEIICSSQGSHYHTAPIIHGTYMPLILSDTIQSNNNPFAGTRAAATWDVITSANDDLFTKIRLEGK